MKRSQKEQVGTNASDMRTSNKLLILNILRKQTVSRSELARQTGLTRAGVTMLVDDLLKAGILEEIGTDRSELGRRPMLLHICSDRYYAIGLSLTRRECRICLLDMNGTLLIKQLVELPSNAEALRLTHIIATQINEMVAGSGVDTQRILGVGISTPGPVDVQRGQVLQADNFSTWHNVSIVQAMDELLPWSSYLQNTSIARTMLEKNYGAGIHYQNFVYIKVADAVGGGVVLHDSLHTGMGQFGNELGHMSIRFDGEQCACGNVGCLTTYAAIPALLLRHESTGYTTWKEVVDHAYQGDRDALHIVQSQSEYLGVAIASLANLLEPEAFILSGDIDYRPNLLLSLIRERVDGTRMMRDRHKIDILGTAISEDAELRAAATIIVEKFYQGEFASRIGG